MSIILAVDPGIRVAGLSVWDDGQLQLATLIYNPERVQRGPLAWLAMAQALKAQYPNPIDALVVELQQQDSRGFYADDMFQVCGVTGATVGLFGARRVVGYYPREWSKVPKAIRHSRLYKPGVLTPFEWTRVEECAKSLKHNRDDAICIGLFHLRQTQQRRAGSQV